MVKDSQSFVPRSRILGIASLIVSGVWPKCGDMSVEVTVLGGVPSMPRAWTSTSGASADIDDGVFNGSLAAPPEKPRGGTE